MLSARKFITKNKNGYNLFQHNINFNVDSTIMNRFNMNNLIIKEN